MEAYNIGWLCHAGGVAGELIHIHITSLRRYVHDVYARAYILYIRFFPLAYTVARNTPAELFVRHDSIRAFLSYLISDLTSHPRRAREEGWIREDKKERRGGLKARYKMPPTSRSNRCFPFDLFEQEMWLFLISYIHVNINIKRSAKSKSNSYPYIYI